MRKFAIFGFTKRDVPQRLKLLEQADRMTTTAGCEAIAKLFTITESRWMNTGV